MNSLQIINISIIHDTLAVIAITNDLAACCLSQMASSFINEVKQSRGFGILDCRVGFASSQ